MNNKFKCKQCGKCCKESIYTIYATQDDIQRWEKQNRKDVLQYLNNEVNLEAYLQSGIEYLFFDPISGK